MRVLAAAALSLTAAFAPSGFAPPTLRVGYGGVGLPVRGFYPGMQNMVANAASLHAGADEGINVNSLSWTIDGGFGNRVTSARLVHDANQNARWDSGETLLAGPILPPYGGSTLTFSGSPLLVVPAAQRRDVILVVDINPVDSPARIFFVTLKPQAGSIAAVGESTLVSATLSGAVVHANPQRQDDPGMLLLSGLKVRFEAERHLLANNGWVTSFQWDFEDDGTFDSTHPTSPVADHVYPAEGPVTARLRMTFADGSFVDRTVVGMVKALDGEVQTIDPDPAASPRTPSVLSIIGRPSANRLYALDQFAGAVTELDATTGSVVTRFSIDPGGGVNPGGIMAISEPQGRLYVFDEGAGFGAAHRLICVNLTTRLVEATVPLPLQTFVDSMTLNNTTQRLYVTLAEAGGIAVVDVNPASPTFHTLIATIPTDFIVRLAVDETSNRIFAPGAQSNIMHEIDGATHTLTRSLPFGPVGLLLDLGLIPSTGRIYSGATGFGAFSPPVQVFNIATGAHEASITMPNSTKALAVRRTAPLKAYAVMGNVGGHHVKVIDAEPASPNFNKVIKTLALPESHNAQEVAVETDDGASRLYVVANEDSGYSTRYVIDTAADLVVHSAAHTAAHLLTEEKTDFSTALFAGAGRFWVAYHGGILVAYDTTTHEPVATVPALGAPGATAFDPSDGKLVYTHTGPYGLRKADPLSGTQLMFANTGPWTGWNFAFNGGATHAYILDLSGASKGLKAVQMSNGSVTSVPLSPDAIVSGHLAANPSTQHLFVTMFKKSTGGFVSVVDVNPASPTFNTELSVVALGAGTQPHRVEVDASTNKVYVAQSNGGTSAAFRIQDGAVAPVAALALPSGGTGLADGDLAVNPDVQRVYFPFSHGVQVFDTATDTSIGSIPVDFPVAVCVSRILNRLYVNAEDSDEFLVYDGTTLASVGTIPKMGDAADFLVADHLDLIYSPLEEGFQVIRASTNEALGIMTDTVSASGFLVSAALSRMRWSEHWSSGPALTAVPSPDLDRIKIFGPGGGDAMAPEISSVSGPSGAGQAGQAVEVTATFTDDGSGHTAEWFWGDGTSSPGTITPTCEVTAYQVTGSHVYAAPGIYQVTLFVRDGAGHETPAELTVVIVDRAGGSVLGNGWIPSPPGAGKAHFTLKSEYEKNEATPSGHVSFDFKVAGIDFTGSSQEWLVVTGSVARVRGVGTLSNGTACGFQATLVDGPDKLRMRIWRADTGAVLYDNQPGQPENGDAATPLGGGQIKIQP